MNSSITYILLAILTVLIIGGLIYLYYATQIYDRMKTYQTYNHDSSHDTPSCFTLGRTVSQSDTFQRCKVIICGLMRDSATSIPDLKVKIKNWTERNFLDYHLIIVENDSADNTRELLLEWQKEHPSKITILGCGVNMPRCKLCLMKTVDHNANLKRIEKMVYLRNLYLDYIKLHANMKFKDFSYCLVTDMDIKSFAFDDGFRTAASSFDKDSTLDAVSSMGISQIRIKGTNLACYTMFDPYAFSMDKTIKSHPFWFDVNSFLFYWFRYGDPDLKVVSSFSGLTIYKKSSLCHTDIKYGTYNDSHGLPICEHVYLNERLGNMVMCPSFLHIVTSNNGLEM